MKFSQIFDQIYIINLPDRADRRNEISAEFERLGDSVASDNIRFFPAHRPKELAGFSSIGAHGCFLSHLGVLQDATQRDFKRILVLEDDCNFANSLKDTESKIINIFSTEDWSIFYGGCLAIDGAQRYDYGSTGFYSVPPQASIMGAHFIAWQGESIAIARDYLTAILSRPAGHPDGGPMHVDGAYSWLRRSNPQLKTLVCSPEIAYQRSSRTDIHKSPWFDTNPATKWAVALMRRLVNTLNRRGNK